jgi:alkaline phosphatase D
MLSAALEHSRPPQRLLFGSCFKQSRGGEQIWAAMAAQAPDAFLFAGDTVYPSKEDDDRALPRLHQAYAALAQDPAFAAFRASVPVLPVWDDHDYGVNDGGGDFAWRQTAEALFETAWGLAADDPRRQRPGVYYSEILGEGEQTVQIIMLDTRFFRSPLKASDKRGSRGRERYIPDPSPSKTLLGDQQWDWLASRLAQPVSLRLIVSSIQLLGDGHGWEGWHQLPHERERLFELLRTHDHSTTIVLSGDRHVAGFYQYDAGLKEPLLEFTSSALNNTIGFPYRRLTLAEDGPRRLGGLYGEANFGAVAIDWAARRVALQLFDRDGTLVREEQRMLRAP